MFMMLSIIVVYGFENICNNKRRIVFAAAFYHAEAFYHASA